MLEACRSVNPELTAIVRVAVETAMRQGEIMGLSWDKVNLTQRTVTLNETKNGTKRVVPLSAAVCKVLSELPRRIDGKVWAYGQEGVKYAFPAA